MKKSGFTLVEMLIVVVIIGILSSALIPRVTGYLAKIRDLKRQADLRNIVAAIEMYRNDHGEIPFSDKSRVVYTGGGLGKLLTEYISAVPRDPGNTQSFMHNNLPYLFNVYPDLKNIKGEYLYWKMYKPNLPKQVAALLIAKAETPELANYVFSDTSISPGDGGTLWVDLDGRYTRGYTIEDIVLCNNIGEKVKKRDEKVATRNNSDCTYSSADQLYYIIKVE